MKGLSLNQFWNTTCVKSYPTRSGKKRRVPSQETSRKNLTKDTVQKMNFNNYNNNEWKTEFQKNEKLFIR